MIFAILSGGLSALVFPPFEQHLLVWFSLVPLLTALLKCDGTRRAAALGSVSGLSFGLVVLAPLRSGHLWTGWAAIPLEMLDAAQARHAWFLVVLWLVGSLLMAAFWAAFATFFRLVTSRRCSLAIVVGPCLWVLVPEYLRSLALGGFHWALLGNAAAAVPQIRQLAAVGGVWLISALVIAVNVAFAVYVASPKKRRPWVVCIAVAALVAVALLWGQWRLRSPARTEPSVGVVALQHGAAENASTASLTTGLDRTILAEVNTTIERLDGRFRLLVLPESVTLGTLSLDSTVSSGRPLGLQHSAGAWESTFEKLIGGRDMALILGTDTVEKGQVYNSMVAFTSRGISGWYHKRRLVPFAERTPRLWPGSPRGGLQYSSGNDPRPISVSGLDLGVLICQEVLFPSLVRESVRAGATILVSGGNDGVFANHAVAEVNARAAQLRAVESGRYLVRAMKTGITAVIDPAGVEVARSESDGPTVILAKVEPLEDSTPYTRFGDWVVLVAAAGVMAAWLVARRRRLFDSPQESRTFSS